MLKTDIVDPQKLLTSGLTTEFDELVRRIRAVGDWDAEVPPRSLYPFPIKWDLMSEEVLRELGVIHEHKFDLNLPVPVLPGKKAWLVMLLRAEISYEAFTESKLFSRICYLYPFWTYTDIFSFCRDGQLIC